MVVAVMIFMQTASKWYMLRLTLFMERGQYSVDSNHFWVRYWLFFLSDYRASQTSPVYGFNQMCWYCMTGTQWRLTLGDEIGRDLTIRFSRQSKYSQSNFHVQTVQSAQLFTTFFLSFFFFYLWGQAKEKGVIIYLPWHLYMWNHTEKLLKPSEGAGVLLL